MAEPTVTAETVPGVILGQFKKTQYLGHMVLPLAEKNHEKRMIEIHNIAGKAMHHVHKDHKHRHLGYSQCYVTTEGVYLYESEEKSNELPTLSWGKTCKEIYCVVMGKRTHLTHNQLACVMMFEKPGEKPVFPVPMECVIIEFHHDHSNKAARFHKACEDMMKALLSTEMHKLTLKEKTETDDSAETPSVEDAITENTNYFEVPVEGEAPEVITAVGKKARASISAAAGDYMTVVTAELSDGQSLEELLAEDSDEEL